MEMNMKKLFEKEYEKSPGGREFIGCYVDSDLNSQITLMAIALGITKSALLRNMAKQWLSSQDPAKSLAIQAKQLRGLKGQAWSDLNEEKFKSLIKKELRKSKVSEQLIGQVVTHYSQMN